MDKLNYYKQQVLYYFSLVRRECAWCKKIFLRENKNEILKCDRCNKKTIFFKETMNNKDNDFIKMITSCNDIITHIRAIKLIKKMRLMNDKERIEFLENE